MDYVSSYIGGDDYQAQEDIEYLLDLIKKQSKDLRVAKSVISKLMKEK